MSSPQASSALAARVEAAAAELSEPERAALVLRERDGAAYADIAATLRVETSDVADLLVSARLVVRERVRGAPPPPILTRDCAEARRGLSARVDGEPVDPVAADWVREHVEGCEACRALRRALREASLAARSWQAPPPAVAGKAPPPAGAVPRDDVPPPTTMAARSRPSPPRRPDPAPEPEPEPEAASRRKPPPPPGAVPRRDVPPPAAMAAAPGPAPANRRAGPRAPDPTVARRRRAALGALLMVLAITAAVATSGPPDSDRRPAAVAPPAAGSADAAAATAAERRRLSRPGASRAPAAPTAPPGQDIVPPPGETFCSPGDPAC